jgi:hypothetical protein
MLLLLANTAAGCLLTSTESCCHWQSAPVPCFLNLLIYPDIIAVSHFFPKHCFYFKNRVARDISFGGRSDRRVVSRGFWQAEQESAELQIAGCGGHTHPAAASPQPSGLPGGNEPLTLEGRRPGFLPRGEGGTLWYAAGRVHTTANPRHRRLRRARSCCR